MGLDRTRTLQFCQPEEEKRILLQNADIFGGGPRRGSTIWRQTGMRIARANPARLREFRHQVPAGMGRSNEPGVQCERRTKVSEELRRAPRLQCSGVAGIQTLPACDKPCPATIINLSIGGCLMESERSLTLAKNEIVELTFCVNQIPIRVRGQVRAIRSKSRIGFQFPRVSDRVRMQLEDLVRELRFPKQTSLRPHRFRHSWL